RYVNNQPTTWVDPSGLDYIDIDLSHKLDDGQYPVFWVVEKAHKDAPPTEARRVPIGETLDSDMPSQGVRFSDDWVDGRGGECNSGIMSGLTYLRKFGGGLAVALGDYSGVIQDGYI